MTSVVTTLACFLTGFGLYKIAPLLPPRIGERSRFVLASGWTIIIDRRSLKTLLWFLPPPLPPSSRQWPH